MLVGLERTLEPLRLEVCAELGLSWRERRLRQCSLEFTGLDFDDADDRIIAVDERLAVGGEGQAPHNARLPFDRPQ
jgi:hypothetical protein